MRALAIALLSVALLTPLSARAGTTGELAGTVRISHGNYRAPIAGATVVVSSEAQKERTTTDASGYFCFVSLSPGTYVVSVSRSGFETATSNVVVAADNQSQVAISLRPRIAHVIVDGPSLVTNLVRQFTVSDMYSIPSESPFYSFDGTTIYALHFVPGLTFGSAPVLSR